jgi:branched-chain amino acid transport system permease protein
MEIVIYGLFRSMEFALLALGFTFAYGVSRLPNFAHGALYILAGFLTWTFVNNLGLWYPLSMLLGVAIVAVIGGLMYRLILIRLRGMPTSEIIGSYAFSLIILEGLRIQGGDIPFLSGFQGFIGPLYSLNTFIDASVNVFGVLIDAQRLIIIGGGILLIAGLWAYTKFTKTGLALTGIAQDEQAAMMLGVDSDKMAMISLGIGSAFAGIAALLILPLGTIVAEKGYEVLIYALAVCIIGGLGSWVGAVIASFILGFGTYMSTYFLGAMWEGVVLVGTIILILAFKPSGLMGKQKELEERT